MEEFLSKDPTKAIEQVKEYLYERLQEIQNGEDRLDEETFLIDLLDIFERSL